MVLNINIQRYVFILALSTVSLFPTRSAPLFLQQKLSTIVKRILPSTVVILTYDRQGDALGQGSGFFINKEGEVITNLHVLRNAKRVEVKTISGETYLINEIIVADKTSDIVIFSVDIPAKEVYFVSPSVVLPEIGERVAVIGSPLGLEQTVSDGIVSAVRELPEFGKIIQITAPISPGSSGSPVINAKGELIGIASFQIISGQNLNFAIPAERIIKLKRKKAKSVNRTARESIVEAEQDYSTGLAFLWLDDFEKALSYFQKAVERNHAYAEAHFQIGQCLSGLRRYAEAIQAYQQAVSIKDNNGEAYFRMAEAYSKLGLRSEALEAYRQAIYVKPDYAEAYHQIGVFYHNSERYLDAIEAHLHAIRIDPNLASAHFGLGSAYLRLRWYNEAIQSYRKAVTIKPTFAEAYFNLGVIYSILGDRVAAFEQYRILRTLDNEMANMLFDQIK